MKLIFMVHGYNRTDNISPVIYLVLEEFKNSEVEILLLDRFYNFKADPHLNFLKSKFRDRICCHWIGKTLGWKQNILGQNLKAKIKKKIYNRIYSSKKVKEKMIEYLKGLVVNFNPDTTYCFFDEKGGSLTKAIFRLFKSKKFNCISLSHGPRPTLNILRKKKYIDMDNRIGKIYKQILHYNNFNEIIMCNKIFWHNYFEKTLRIIKSAEEICGLKKELENKLNFLGSLRYSKKWLSIRQSYISEFEHGTDKVKVLILPTKEEKNACKEETENLTQIFSQFENLFFAVKPYPGRENYFTDKKADNMKEFTRPETTSMIDWADVVMFWATGVSYEAVMKNKTIVYLGYLTLNYTVYDKLKFGWRIHTRDDLVEALRKISNQPGFRPKDYGSRKQFIEEAIKGGDSTPVYKRYHLYFKELFKKI